MWAMPRQCDSVRLLLIACPGAGKGTQAKKLAAYYDVIQFSSGDVLRGEIHRGTRLGKLADAYVRRGDLVPDELVLELLSERLFQDEFTSGYVLDGFPRTVSQAQALAELAQSREAELQAVVHLAVGRDELLRRLRARGPRRGRTDDTRSTIANRFEVFEAQTEPLLGYYQARGLLVQVDGHQPVERVFDDITTLLDSQVLAG